MSQLNNYAVTWKIWNELNELIRKYINHNYPEYIYNLHNKDVAFIDNKEGLHATVLEIIRFMDENRLLMNNEANLKEFWEYISSNINNENSEVMCNKIGYIREILQNIFKKPLLGRNAATMEIFQIVNDTPTTKAVQESAHKLWFALRAVEDDLDIKDYHHDPYETQLSYVGKDGHHYDPSGPQHPPIWQAANGGCHIS